jgi:long-chain acyl-CoA synthetase
MNGLIEGLRQQAVAKPDAVALRSRHQQLSFADLLVAVEQAALQLQSLQLQAIGLYLDNGIDWIVFDLAALSTGISVVPLPRFFSDTQITHAIADANLDGIVFDRALPSAVNACGNALPGFSDSRVQRIESSLVRPARKSSTLAKISYTSGSTGTPKGIQLDVELIEQTVASLCQAIGDLDIKTHLSVLPYATLLENIAGVYVPLLLGCCVHAEPSADVGLTDLLGLDPAKLQACFNRVQPDSMIITPQLLDVLCQLVDNAAISPGSLVFVAVGGARVAPALLQRARRVGIPAYEGYGLTEFASVATLNTPQNDRVGSVGKPLPGVNLELAGDGEICLAREPLTGVQGEQRELVKTGDFGSIDEDGFIYVHGRKSNLIVLANGRNVAPEWIEAELNASALIGQSYVFSESGERVAALIASSAPDAAIDAEILRINGELPAYARLHQWHRLTTPFSREQQTLTANGRLKRCQIEQQLPGLLAQAPVSPRKARNHTQFSLQESKSC